MWPFNNTEKYWLVNNHKIKKVTVRPHPMNNPGYRGHHPPPEKKYRCIYCEKTFGDRDRFKNEECYDVIYE